MNWYKISFSLDEVTNGYPQDIIDWFSLYVMKNDLVCEAFLFEADEISESGIRLFICTSNNNLIFHISKKCRVNPSQEPLRDELCVLAGNMCFGDSVFKNNIQALNVLEEASWVSKVNDPHAMVSKFRFSYRLAIKE